MGTHTCSHLSHAGLIPPALSAASLPPLLLARCNLSHSHTGEADFLPSSVGGDRKGNTRSGRIRCSTAEPAGVRQAAVRPSPRDAKCRPRSDRSRELLVGFHRFSTNSTPRLLEKLLPPVLQVLLNLPQPKIHFTPEGSRL